MKSDYSPAGRDTGFSGFAFCLLIFAFCGLAHGQTTVTPKLTARTMKFFVHALGACADGEIGFDTTTKFRYCDAGVWKSVPRLDAANTWTALNTFSSGIKISGGTLSAADLGAALNIIGATSGNGNLLLSPGNVAANASVFIETPRLDQPGLIVRDALGTTTGNSLEIRKADNTLYLKVIGGTDAGAPGAFLSRDHFSITSGTYSLGGSTNRWANIFGAVGNFSGLITASGGVDASGTGAGIRFRKFIQDARPALATLEIAWWRRENPAPALDGLLFNADGTNYLWMRGETGVGPVSLVLNP